MTFEIVSIDYEHTLGATAGTLQIPFEVDTPIHGILMTLKFLQAGAGLPSISDLVTQWGSAVKIKSGGAEIYSTSIADLHHLLGLATPNRVAVHESDGTGADNHVMNASFPIPLAPFNWGLPLHPDFGLKPKDKSVVLELSYPADANDMDNRALSISAISLVGKTPTRVMERLTRNLTPSATGWDNYIKLPSGNNISLYDLAFFQTTALSAGTTTDATSLEQISLELASDETSIKKVNARALHWNLGNLSLTATSPEESGNYVYMPTSPLGSFEWAIPLPKDARLNINAGVADAIRFYGGIVRPLV
jgi:hypothetical protein